MTLCLKMSMWRCIRGTGLVETGSNQVDKEHFVVLDDAEDALVVVTGAFGAEVDDDARGRVWFDSADILREAKHVVCIGV